MTPTSTPLRGCGTALVTPFTRDGAVDERALRALAAWQIEQGVHFLVPCGSTGEAATMTPDEHRRVVEIVVEEARGRVPVVAGAGSNDTRRAIELSRAMAAAGATHLLHVSPMYNKPPQRGLIAHFRAIADATELPIIIYNVPGRTGSNIEARTTLALAAVDGIAGIKEASGNMAQIGEILRERPPGFVVLSGDDAVTLDVMTKGGEGVISVISNAAPRAMAELCDRCASGDLDGARSLDARLRPWMEAAFIESNPIPAKAALAMMGRIENVLRLPLVPLAAEHEAAVRQALETAGAFA
jgi:4-hydroxy-tetrahydrodipicolinate synthase